MPRHNCRKNVARHRRNRRREYWVRWRVERKLFEIGVAVINMLAPPAPDMDFVAAIQHRGQYANSPTN